MIAKLMSAIMNLIIKLVNVLLTPINLLISQFLPQEITDGLNSIGGFFQTISNGIGWVVSASGIPSTAIAIIVATMIFKLTVPLLVHATKLAIKWYDKLKP